MRSIMFSIVVAVVILLSLASVYSQVVRPQLPGTDRQDRERRRNDADFERQMAEMHALERRAILSTQRPLIADSEPKLTREQRERVLTFRRIAKGDADKYASFLDQPRTGVFKLFPDIGCVSKNVVSVSGDCEKYVPVSSSFTFRTKVYGDEAYHDIRFLDDRILSDSFFSQGILTVVGDEPIENVDLSHPAFKFLNEFEPDLDPKAAAARAREFRTGVESGSFRYTDSVEPRENATYAMRMIAYRLDNGLKPYSPDLSLTEMMFLSLTFDKRLDVKVVFRVINKDENGGLTIVWKELGRAEAPKIKFPKGQELKDFRPAKRDWK